MRMRTTVLVVAALLLAAACDDDDVADATDTPVAAADHADEADHDADEADHDADHDDGTVIASYLEASPKAQLVFVQMGNFLYDPETIEIEAGAIVEIAFQNVEPLVHDFTIDEIDADVHVSYLAGTDEHAHGGVMAPPEAAVHFALTEVGTGVVHLKVHEPGRYAFYCTVPGHREAGMEGTLIVR